jgi:hypothetical protein
VVHRPSVSDWDRTAELQRIGRYDPFVSRPPPVPRGFPRGLGFAFPGLVLDAALRSTAALARFFRRFL